jgi:hypothetical protein
VLETVCKLDKASAKVSVKLQTPQLLGYNNRVKIPAISASEMIKFVSLICIQKSEVSMDQRAVSMMMLQLLAVDTPDA